MRSDMAKVIVERPRKYRGYHSRKSPGYLRTTRNREECLPTMQAMRPQRGYRQKSLNENLAPLLRWLASQVGRPWNDVHRDINEHLRLSNAVQKHVLDHVRDFVRQHVFTDADGIFCDRVEKGRAVPLGAYGRNCFYVCPHSGVLARLDPTERGDLRFRKVTAEHYLLRRRGIWYSLELAEAPPLEQRQGIVDAYTKCSIHSRAYYLEMWARKPPWGRTHYVRNKRQLSKAEIRHYMETRGASTPA
jgi:hypothetical protein